MLSDSETSLSLQIKEIFRLFQSLVQSVRISPILAKMTRSKDVSPTGEHDKKHANKKKNGVCGKQEPNAKGKNKALKPRKKQNQLFKVLSCQQKGIEYAEILRVDFKCFQAKGEGSYLNDNDRAL